MSINQQQQQYYPNQAPSRAGTAATSEVAERAKFIERTYLHLAGAIAAFVGLEFAFFQLPFMTQMAASMLQTWWLVLVLFIGVSWVADYWARHATRSAAWTWPSAA